MFVPHDKNVTRRFFQKPNILRKNPRSVPSTKLTEATQIQIIVPSSVTQELNIQEHSPDKSTKHKCSKPSHGLKKPAQWVLVDNYICDDYKSNETVHSNVDINEITFSNFRQAGENSVELTYHSGDMLKTDKSTLSKQLTSQIDSENPDKVDIEIIDGFYYMYQIGATLPQTFGKLAESILIKLCAKKAKEVHIVFDRYLKPSIRTRKTKQERKCNTSRGRNIILGDSQDDAADNEEDSDETNGFYMTTIENAANGAMLSYINFDGSDKGIESYNDNVKDLSVSHIQEVKNVVGDNVVLSNKITDICIGSNKQIVEGATVAEQSHMISNNASSFKCDVLDCNKLFDSEEKLKKHKSSHYKRSGQRPLKQAVECPVKNLDITKDESCGRIYLNREELMKHLNEDHTIDQASHKFVYCINF
ncbi:hypothetical protein EVAR_61874_1 [Eumeta japonica]|uniref:C2H2-type domain-containing protein n=1 Tax=Eumeta variegata TaxID=151549 RepID=A0A4C1ZMB6_EUMVA|nr:hypothetical protein EVAR_61874_1 [Eumeta japonica]